MVLATPVAGGRRSKKKKGKGKKKRGLFAGARRFVRRVGKRARKGFKRVVRRKHKRHSGAMVVASAPRRSSHHNPGHNPGGFLSRIEHGFDRHEKVAGAALVLTGGVGGVMLDKKYPEGVGPLATSTAASLGAFAASWAAKKLGAKRISKSALYAGAGGLIGAAVVAAKEDRIPLLSRKKTT